MEEFKDKDFFTKKNSLADIIRHEMEVFRQHQSSPFNDYVRNRSTYLSTLKNADDALEFIAAFNPRIGVFAGSFNPFHKGHYNVLLKAEKIFDKVIIAFGQNPEKQAHVYKVPSTLQNRQIEQYNGLLTDFIQSLKHDAIVIRGLRNSTDFQYEQNQYRYIQELMPDIKIVNIFCDKEFEHISSSGIRTLQKFGRHQNYLLD